MVRQYVILIAHSMGGVVSRYYIESGLYRGRNDVAKLFTFGSPHSGTNIAEIVRYLWGYQKDADTYLKRQEVSYELSKTGMEFINSNFLKQRANGVTYYLMGGAAPYESLSALGKILTLDWLIPGNDDGFIETNSALGLTPTRNVRHWQTDEVHAPQLGTNSYFFRGDGGQSTSYKECLKPVLLDNEAVCEHINQNNNTSLAITEETPNLAVRIPFESGNLLAGQTVTRIITLEGGPSLFLARWQTGQVSVKLIDPDGQIIDPAYAAAYPETLTYETDGTSASYYLSNTIAGEWKLVVQADNVPAKGTTFFTSAAFNSNLSLTAETDQIWYSPSDTAIINASITGAPINAEVIATIGYADGANQTINLATSGSGQYQAAFNNIPSKPGYAKVNISATGRNADGFFFERDKDLFFQISPNSASLNGAYNDTPETNPSSSSFKALAVTVGINAVVSGTFALAADLMDVNGNFVAHSSTFEDISVGVSNLTLYFDGNDIRTSQRNGPYTLTNVFLVDNREGMLILAETNNVYTTAFYDYNSFGTTNNIYLPIIIK